MSYVMTYDKHFFFSLNCSVSSARKDIQTCVQHWAENEVSTYAKIKSLYSKTKIGIFFCCSNVFEHLNRLSQLSTVRM